MTTEMLFVHLSFDLQATLYRIGKSGISYLTFKL